MSDLDLQPIEGGRIGEVVVSDLAADIGGEIDPHSATGRPGTVDEWTDATLNYPIYNGDHLWADRGARTELHIGSTALRMDGETALAVL